MTNKEKYIADVLENIKDKTSRQEIKNEIEAHIEDRIEYYTNAGYDLDYAEKAALSKMGESDRLGLQLNSLHNNMTLTISVIINHILCAACICTPLIAVIVYNDRLLMEVDLPKFLLIQALAEILLFTVNYYLSSKLLSKWSFYTFGILILLDYIIKYVSNVLCFFYADTWMTIDYSEYTDFYHKMADILYQAYTWIALIMLIVSFCYGSYLNRRMKGRSSQILNKRYYSFNYVFIASSIIGTVLEAYILIHI